MDVDLVGFLTIGVIGIQYVRMMTQVIYRWTLERKWSPGSLKLSSGVPQLGYYAGMLSVPLVSLCIQVACVLAVAFVSSSFRLALRPLPLLGGCCCAASSGLRWVAC